VSSRILSFLTEQQRRVEEALLSYISEIEGPPELLEAMKYSLMAGGKRIRPAFVFATIRALRMPTSHGMEAACALEMIHTYSLIHDDLPAMDNDDFRRGKLTNHKVFGDAMAILAGDALLTHAFYLIALEKESNISTEVRLQMVRELSLYSGSRGMVGGQVADILGENRELTLDELYYIHEHKTADLLTCSVRFGCYIGHASPKQLDDLTMYAKHIGFAFQIQDDILDEIGDESKLGKRVGSDRDNQKTTFVSLLGLEVAKAELYRHVDLAKKALYQADVEQEILLDLADFMINRET
jgi:geranylgeranyl diphosphate synthase type II